MPCCVKITISREENISSDTILGRKASYIKASFLKQIPS